MQRLLGLLALLGFMAIYCTPVQAAYEHEYELIQPETVSAIQLAQMEDDPGEPPSEPPDDIEAPEPQEG